MFVVTLFKFVFLAGQTMVCILDEVGTSVGDVRTEVGTSVGNVPIEAGTSADDVQTGVGTSASGVHPVVMVPIGRRLSACPTKLDGYPVLACSQFRVRKHRIPTLRGVFFLVLGILTLHFEVLPELCQV